MRCIEVTRELSAPTGRLEPAELARHLAACPDCAAQSARGRRLDAVWEATRPVEPSAAAWDAVWAGVCRGLEAAPDATVPLAPAWWRRRGPLVGLAAAAALLVAVLALVEYQDGAHPPLAAGPGPAPAVVGIGERPDAPPREIERPPITFDEAALVEGKTPLFHMDPGVTRTRVDYLGSEEATEVPANLDLLNDFEALAQEGTS